MKSETTYERRWVVLAMDPGVTDRPYELIEDGFLDAIGDTRVRISSLAKPQVIVKTGRGEMRQQKIETCPLPLAKLLLESTPLRLKKKRYRLFDFKVDVFQGALKGAVLLEDRKEMSGTAVALPPWIHKSIEVTDSLWNAHLARMAYDIGDDATVDSVGGLDFLLRSYLGDQPPLIVLTGAPCSGKSAGLERFKKEFPYLLHCVPETATIIIGQVGAKPPVGDVVAMNAWQRNLYKVQHGFESVSLTQARRDGRSGVVADRGTPDAIAYMGLEAFERVNRTTLADEYRRYLGVICLEPPPPDVYERHKADNPTRTETYEQVLVLDQGIVGGWAPHRNFVRVLNGNGFEDKYAAMRAALLRLLGRS